MITDTFTGIITFGSLLILSFVAIELVKTIIENHKARLKRLKMRNEWEQAKLKKRKAANWKVMKEGVKDEKHYTTTICIVRGLYKGFTPKTISRIAK